jgi:hypothetical protein
MVYVSKTAEYNKKRLCNSSSKKYRRRWFLDYVQALREGGASRQKTCRFI